MRRRRRRRRLASVLSSAHDCHIGALGCALALRSFEGHHGFTIEEIRAVASGLAWKFVGVYKKETAAETMARLGLKAAS